MCFETVLPGECSAAQVTLKSPAHSHVNVGHVTPQIGDVCEERTANATPVAWLARLINPDLLKKTTQT